MENQELHEKWPEIQEKLLKKYPQLTREELALEIGKEGEMLKHLQGRVGKNWKDVKNFLSVMG